MTNLSGSIKRRGKKGGTGRQTIAHASADLAHSSQELVVGFSAAHRATRQSFLKSLIQE